MKLVLHPGPDNHVPQLRKPPRQSGFYYALKEGWPPDAHRRGAVFRPRSGEHFRKTSLVALERTDRKNGIIWQHHSQPEDASEVGGSIFPISPK